MSSSLKKDLRSLLLKPSYIIPVLLTAALSYGFFCAQDSVGIDDLTADRYSVWGSELFSQGRFTAPLMHMFLGLTRPVPWFLNALSLVLMILAGAIMCVILYDAASRRLPAVALTVFSCVYLSYPMVNEIFVYYGGNLNTAVGFVLTALAVYLTQKWDETRKKKYLVFTGLIMLCVTSLYESFCAVFIVLTLARFILKFYYSGDERYVKPGKAIVNGLIIMIPLAAAVVAEAAGGKLLQVVFSVPPTSYDAQVPAWFGENSFKEIVENYFEIFVFYYILPFEKYLPVRLLDLTVIAVTVAAVVEGIRKKNATVALEYIALTLSLFALGVVAGHPIAPRSSHSYFSLYIAFALTLALTAVISAAKRAKAPAVTKTVRSVAAALCFLLVFAQCNDLNTWLSLEVQRYDYEKRLASSIAEELIANYDLENNRVVIVGYDKLPDQISEQISVYTDDPIVARTANAIEALGNKEFADKVRTLIDSPDGSYRFIRNSIRPYLGWSTLAFGDVNVETEKFLSYLGYDIDLDNSPEARGAVFYDFLPAYPAKGSVTQDVDMIIVNLGSYPEAAFSSEKDSRNAE